MSSLWQFKKEFELNFNLTDQLINYQKEFFFMAISDTQVFIALVVALIPGILAFRLATELYK